MNGDQTKYWSLQGTVDLMDRVNGQPVGGLWAGDCSSIEYSPSPSIETFRENHTGSRGTGLSMVTGIEATVAITMHNMSIDLLPLLFGGELVDQDTDAIVGKAVTPATLKVGMVFLLGSYDATSVSLVDSTAGTPVPLVAGTHYELDAKTGRGRLLNITGLTGPVKVSGTPGTVKYVKMLSNVEIEKWIHITAKNTVNGMSRLSADFYLAKLSPASFQFINEGRGEAVLNCNIVSDPTKQIDSDLGTYGRIVDLA